MTTDADALKQEAAERAAAYLTDGMVIGLGTGTTTDFFLRAVGARVQAGLRISGVPTSTRSEGRARALGIPLTTLDANPRLALAVDGADEVVLASFDAVKGRGGALLREKLVALAADLFIVIIDESKLAAHIGEHGAIPVEVVPFAWQSTAARLAALGAAWRLRGAPPTTRPARPNTPLSPTAGTSSSIADGRPFPSRRPRRAPSRASRAWSIMGSLLALRDASSSPGPQECRCMSAPRPAVDGAASSAGPGLPLRRRQHAAE